MTAIDKDGYIVNPYQQFIATSRYAKWNDNLGRRETWAETVDRYMIFMREHLETNNGYNIPQDMYDEMREAIVTMQVLPSMRALMTAGPALKKNNIAGYNCSYVPVDSPRAFDEILFILMHGTGVGFSVESKYTERLPVIADDFEETSTVIVVEDSKEGWQKSFKELIAMLYAGNAPKWDVSKVRPKGARLKTFGGRASGPQPLVELFEFTTDLFKRAHGRKLSTLECHDLVCKVAEIVVVGGVRRSALISLSDLKDDEVAKAKVGEWWTSNGQRALANNSAVYETKPFFSTFMREWTNLYESKSGERGIFNREAAGKAAGRSGRRQVDGIEWGTNPSLVAGTRVWTTEGVVQIEQLEDKNFFVRNLNGEISEAKCWLSGRNQEVYRLNLEGGHYYDATAQHKWPVWNGKEYVKKTTPELKNGDLLKNLSADYISHGSEGTYQDGFVAGWNLGDGWLTQRPAGLQIGFIVEDEDRESGIHEILTDYFASVGSKSSLLDKKEVNVNSPGLREKFKQFGVQHKTQGIATAIWEADTSEEFRKGYIDGLFSADGCVEKDSSRIKLVTAHEKLARDVSDMLGFYGIKTSVRRRSGITNFGEFDSWNLSITGYANVKRFSELFKFTHDKKQSRMNDHVNSRKSIKSNDFIKVVSVEKLDEKVDVWDISVKDKTHAFQLSHCVTGNCSEINLRPYQFCNLSTIPVQGEDDMKSLKRKVELATILGTWQSTLTNFKGLRAVWKKNTEEERLLGVSMTGIFGNKLLNGRELGLEERLTQLKEHAIKINAKLSEEIGIAQSTAITCVKPEGNSSQLTMTSSGIHPWYSEYYIRTVRSDKKDPLGQFLRDSDIPCEDDVMNPETGDVFSFPIKAPEGALIRSDITAVKHLDLWLTYQRYWCEHKPSVTINVKEDEWLDVAAWVYRNFDEVTGVSFLPYSDHTYRQAPYQEITAEDFKVLSDKMPKNLEWSLLSHYENTDEAVIGGRELACSSGACEVVDLTSSENK